MFGATNKAVRQSANVLIVTPSAVQSGPLAAELIGRSALLKVATTVAEAGAAVRATAFDVIFVTPRQADAETALLIQFVRGASANAPKVIFIGHPLEMAGHPMSVDAADACASSLLSPVELADIALPREVAPVLPAEPASSPASAPEPAAHATELSILPVAETIARAAEAIARAAESIAYRTEAEQAGRAAAPVQQPVQVWLPQPAPAPIEQHHRQEMPPAAPQFTQPAAPAAEALPPIQPVELPLSALPEVAAPVAPATPLAPVALNENSARPAPALKSPAVAPPRPTADPQPATPAPAAPPAAAPAPVAPPAPASAPAGAEIMRLPMRVGKPAPVREIELKPEPMPDAAPAAKVNRRFYDRASDAAPGFKTKAAKLFYLTGWSVLAAGIVGLTTWPISTQAQFTLGVCALIIMTVIRKLRLGGIWRTTFLAIGTTMILRYIYWRTTTTLPPFHDLVNFTPGFLLYVAEMYCVVMFFISMFIIADPIDRKPPPALPEDRLPTVDVFIPSYNESADLLATTVAAASQMDYPRDRFNIYLLDDGGTDQKCNQSDPEKAAEAIARRAELQALCLDMGITYITRAKNEHAKAGNMNNALVQTNGEIIVVFDADHAPARQFLRETVGYFSQDRKLFLVQTPHFFINPDPVEKNLQTFDRMPSENEMFYGTIQKGLDKWNGAFFCGSAALISRRALESVGGFSGLSITEDCETAFDLHTRGWNSLYVDKPLIAGLQPESLVSFIGQRSRWCRGMIQILVLKNPLLTRSISMKQRIAYISSMFFWLFPIPRMLFLFAPFLYIFGNMQIFQSNAQEFFAYVTIYMLTHMTIQNYIHGRTRWPWISEAYEYVQSVYLVKGIWGVLLNPRKPTFNVTAKGITLDNDHLSELAWPYFALFGLILFSLVVAVWRFAVSAEVDELLLIVGGWSLYNLVIAGVALGIVAERRERRKTPRLEIDRRGELEVDGVVVPVKIADASIGGMRITIPGGRLPDQFRRGKQGRLQVIPERDDLVTEPIPCTIHNVTNNGDGATYGLKFEGLRPVHFRGIADAMYADMKVFEKFRASRRSIKGITMGTLQFFWWSCYHTVRAFYYAIALRSGAPKVQDGEQPAITEFKGAHPQTHTPAAPVEALKDNAPANVGSPAMIRPLATAH